ncbi:hypothetical protein L6452_18361 [Arctium lappa]|uniref:Uncharacterized protein n=1 Tax=Arctium lappa TaxID=4217 RepID=A0ACB9C5Z9_ARCLA|nr:hypothetical protein L6452_18361 [Arctium lappa]
MTDLRSGGRKLSFDVLATTDSFFDDDETFLLRSDSGPPIHQGEGGVTTKSSRRKRKHKGSKKKKKASDELDLNKCGNSNGFIINSNCRSFETTAVVYEEAFVPPQEKSVYPVISSVRETPELRQRSSVASVGVGSSGEEAIPMYRIDENVKEVDDSSWTGRVTAKEFDTELMMKQTAEMNVNGHHVGRKLEKDQSLDWKRLMAEKDPNHKFLFERSPVKYFMEEMYGGNSLRMTTTLANEKDRERVYDTIFRMPWRCELHDGGIAQLVRVNFCCSELFSMGDRTYDKLYAVICIELNIAQLSGLIGILLIDVGFFVCLDSFLSLLTVMPIRILTTSWRLLKTRQFKMLSAAELSDFGCFLMLASGVILLQQTDISLIYHMIRGQGTIKLYVVYNVLEVKDQRIGCLADSIERFHIASFLIFVLAQNILEAEGPWFENFLYNALVVYICELMIDIIKHSFIAKFNEIKPIVYSEFLEDLCKQTLNIQPENPKKTLTFVPLAPASVVSDSSVESSLCSTYSLWSDSMENCVDIDVVGDDVCDAYKSESDDRYGSK